MDTVGFISNKLEILCYKLAITARNYNIKISKEDIRVLILSAWSIIVILTMAKLHHITLTWVSVILMGMWIIITTVFLLMIFSPIERKSNKGYKGF